ncbi:hypothetical protein ANABIO32_08320 [Rossellomorea marisflavi]|nr:hypothetical protein ANABIO32_08320 [Rossellomorea marisflavi]
MSRLRIHQSILTRGAGDIPCFFYERGKRREVSYASPFSFGDLKNLKELLIVNDGKITRVTGEEK